VPLSLVANIQQFNSKKIKGVKFCIDNNFKKYILIILNSKITLDLSIYNTKNILGNLL